MTQQDRIIPTITIMTTTMITARSRSRIRQFDTALLAALRLVLIEKGIFTAADAQALDLMETRSTATGAACGPRVAGSGVQGGATEDGAKARWMLVSI